MEMTAGTAALLLCSAALGGGLNAVAGGGSFLTFPALLLSGVPPIDANATSTVALLPGSLAGAAAYRGPRLPHRLALLLVSLLGGALGAWLLLRTSQRTFARILPYLMLPATLLFAAGPTLSARLRRRKVATAEGAVPAGASLGLLLLGQLLIGVYGGYFGGGIGILMLAALSLFGMRDLHAMNALKNLLAGCMNGVAVVTFVAAGIVHWPQAALMAGGAAGGAFLSARYARRLPTWVLRLLVTLVGLAISAYLFVKNQRLGAG